MKRRKWIVKEIITRLKAIKNMTVDLNGKKYNIQVYDDKRQGNITRLNQTVLTKFYIDDNGIRFAFQKEEIPYEFDYPPYPVAVEAELEMIKRIPSQYSEELYLVLKKFLEMEGK